MNLRPRTHLLLALATALLLAVISSPAAADKDPSIDPDTEIRISYFYDYIHQTPLTTTLHPGELFTFYDQTGGCGPGYRDVAACETNCTGQVRAYNHDCLSGSGPGTFGPWVSAGCSTAREHGYSVECCLLSDDPGETVLLGVVDASKRLGPKWTKTVVTPLVSGDHTLVLHWESDANLRMSVKEKTTGARIGANASNDHPKTLTVQLEAEVEYRIAVWAKHGSADFSVTMTPPVGYRIFARTVDADRVAAPKWTRTIYTPIVTGDHQFVLDWEGDANLRISVRDHATGKWIGQNTTTAQPKNVTVHLKAAVEYKIAVWAKHGSADFTVSAHQPSSPGPS